VRPMSGALALLTGLLLFITIPAYADKVDDFVKAKMERNHIPGVAVAVIRNGKVEKLANYGSANLEWDAPVTPDTAFQIASSTKPFTGTALMMLVEEGKISLDDPISKYVPDTPESWSKITVRNLSTHSSGISDGPAPQGDKSVGAFVKAAIARPLAYQPGERAAYGLSDFVVLTYIIEKVSGKPFTEFLAERIFKPLGMTGTRFDEAVEEGAIRKSQLIRHRASVYNWDGSKQNVYAFLYGNWTYSAGGLYSTISDLSKFFAALDEGRLLKPAALDAMWKREKLGNGKTNGYGVGWVVGSYNGHPTVGHSGGPALSDIIRFPEDKTTIIVLTNQFRLYPHLAQGIADLYYPPQPAKEIPSIEDTDPKTTEMLKKILLDAASGHVNDAMFTVEAQKGFVPSFREFGPVYFASMEPLQRFTLIEEKKEGENLVRKYQAFFGPRAKTWTFVLTLDRKIVSMEPDSD
jgi:CubicO group peptidase (beta-lactamase class C family)